MNTSMLGMENEMTSDMEEFATNLTGVVSDLDGVASEFTEVHFEMDGMASNITNLTSNVSGLTSDLTDLQMELDENLEKISKNFSMLLPNDNGTFCKYFLFLFLIKYVDISLVPPKSFYIRKLQ